MINFQEYNSCSSFYKFLSGELIELSSLFVKIAEITSAKMRKYLMHRLYGLELVIFVDQKEYIGLFSQEAGVRVAIHKFGSVPFPEDFGYNVQTGTATSFNIRVNEIIRLEAPYGEGCTWLEKDKGLFLGKDTHGNPDVYQWHGNAYESQYFLNFKKCF